MRQSETSSEANNSTLTAPVPEVQDILNLSDREIAKSFCKVQNFVYICIGKRCNKQQNSIHTEPHYSGVPETLSYLLRYCTFAKTQGASLLLCTYIN
jgi:hypothetical protein